MRYLQNWGGLAEFSLVSALVSASTALVRFTSGCSVWMRYLHHRGSVSGTSALSPHTLVA
jgi:hypothetical protein